MNDMRKLLSDCKAAVSNAISWSAFCGHDDTEEHFKDLLSRIDAALAEPEQEPVAWMRLDDLEVSFGRNAPQADGPWSPLYPESALQSSLRQVTEERDEEKEIDSQPVPVPVEPALIKSMRGGCSDTMQIAIDYIDTLQSELRRVTEERDMTRNLLDGVSEQYEEEKTRRAAAESRNKRLVEMLREIEWSLYWEEEGEKLTANLLNCSRRRGNS